MRWRLETEYGLSLIAPDAPRVPRPEQLTPTDPDWLIWLIMAGRGYGKTRSGAEDASDFCRTHPGHRMALVTDDFGEGRDVCIEGESGLLSIVPPSCVEHWNRSHGHFLFTNGAELQIYSAERPGELRGPQWHRAWCDELAKWRNLAETWQNLMLGLRLPSDQPPRCVITTTPKPLGLLLDLEKRPTVRITQGSTYDNARNLAPAFVEEITRYEGTRYGEQEIHGMLLADYEGAAWKREWIDRDRRTATELPPLRRIAVGVDPSTWAPEAGIVYEETGRGIETGIVVVGVDEHGDCWVVEDCSCRESPADWSREVVAAYRRHRANAVVIERNVGPWVVSTVNGAADGGEPVRFARDPKSNRPGVMAKDGKRARIEPVAAWYEAGRVHHVGTHRELEDQQCSWDPMANWSPDRVDALVWAITWLAPWKPHVRADISSGPRGAVNR